jgi:hypothetical protein
VAKNSISGQLRGEYVSLKALQLQDVSVNNIDGILPNIWKAFGTNSYQLRCLVLHSNPYLDMTFPGNITNGMKVTTNPSNTC